MKAESAQQVTIAGQALSPADEIAHTLIVGGVSDGSKSLVFKEMLGCIARRGDRAVVICPGGQYIDDFYLALRGDTVLNPYWADGPKWHVFRELTDAGDIELFAHAIAATTQFPGDAAYTDHVRYLVASILFRMRHDGVTTNEELLRRVKTIRQENALSNIGQEAAQHVVGLQPDFFEGIRIGAQSALEALVDVQNQRGSEFSIRNWVANGRGLLFMPHRANVRHPHASLIAVWLRLVMAEIIRQTSGERPLWLFVDSLCTVGRIESLSTTVQALGPNGGRGVFAIGDYPALAELYALEGYELPLRCGNQMVFQCSGETAELAAALMNRGRLN